MPSPFPGMDPYLESHWRDMHARLIIYACDALQALLPSQFRARVEEAVLLETPDGVGTHPLYPDVRVVEYGGKRGIKQRQEGGIAVAEPIIIPADYPVTETFIEIIDRESGNRVVTVIEFLSPANKSPGENREQYRRKQRQICSSDTNLVEIDLNRFGVHTLAFELARLGPTHRTAYMASVRRAHGIDVEVYRMPLWERLPTIKIPLRKGDTDVPLDLQTIIDQCYRNGGYEGTLDYAIEPDPPLDGADKEWADAELSKKGLRTAKKPARRKNKPK